MVDDRVQCVFIIARVAADGPGPLKLDIFPSSKESRWLALILAGHCQSCLVWMVFALTLLLDSGWLGLFGIGIIVII